MHRTIKTIVILKPKSVTAGFETGTAGMQNSNLMSDRLSITPRSYSRGSDMFGVDILGATLFLTKDFTLFRTTFFALFCNVNQKLKRQC